MNILLCIGMFDYQSTMTNGRGQAVDKEDTLCEVDGTATAGYSTLLPCSSWVCTSDHACSANRSLQLSMSDVKHFGGDLQIPKPRIKPAVMD